MNKPVINDPCPENWDEMTPEKQGRFCASCAKIVIDFTQKTTEEIVDFLTNRNPDSVCGRAKKSQLIPVRISSRMKAFAAAIYMVFGSFLFSSCGSDGGDGEVMGKMCIDTTGNTQHPMNVDSIAKADSALQAVTLSDSFKSDSAKMMSTMNVLDSIMNSRKK